MNRLLAQSNVRLGILAAAIALGTFAMTFVIAAVYVA